jgi:hypothetical protein
MNALFNTKEPVIKVKLIRSIAEERYIVTNCQEGVNSVAVAS